MRSVTLEGEDSKLSPLSFFSTLTLHADTHEFTFNLNLSRSESFPPHRYNSQRSQFCPDTRLVAPPVPQNAAHLQLDLGERLGAGGTGAAYSARVLGPLPNLPAPVPSELVVKIAKVNHCRNLAREAWIYTWLDRQPTPVGNIVPRCYGLFTARLEDCGDESLTASSVEFPWSISEDEVEQGLQVPFQDDWLDDDVVDRDYIWEPSERRTKENSPWNPWSPNPDDPLVAVLLLEKGGSVYNEIDDKNPQVLEDVRLVLHDLVLTGVAHCDFRMANLIRAPPTNRICPRHNRVHQWNVIDFNRSWVVFLTKESFVSGMEIIDICLGYREPYFYGWQP